MVQQAIAYAGFVDVAQFGISDVKALIRAVAVGPVDEGLVKR